MCALVTERFGSFSEIECLMPTYLRLDCIAYQQQPFEAFMLKPRDRKHVGRDATAMMKRESQDHAVARYVSTFLWTQSAMPASVID